MNERDGCKCMNKVEHVGGKEINRYNMLKDDDGMAICGAFLLFIHIDLNSFFLN